MSSSLRIAEVADRVGISTATVRYYERIGVLPEPERADNGYRLYDDHTVERLGFIARAKQLGCTLEEIGELVVAWDGGECGPIQDRLRSLVADKLAAARAEVVALVTLTAELRRAAAALERHRPTGGCDDRCGCITDTTAAARAVGVDPGAEPNDGVVPIACTLELDQVADRLDDWSGVLAGTAATAIDGGVRVELGEDVDIVEVLRLAAAEQDCCRFLSFRLTIDDRGHGLEIVTGRAPADFPPEPEMSR